MGNRFVNNFLRAPLCCLGSREAATQNNCGTLRRHFTKPPAQVTARPSTPSTLRTKQVSATISRGETELLVTLPPHFTQQVSFDESC